jgi:hypothetical protein
MKTVLKDLLQSDWAPAMEASTRSLVMAVAIPAAIALVLVQWLLFTYQRPLAGVLALVPVRKREPIAPSSPRSGVAAPPPAEISLALDAALDQAIGLKRPVRPVGPDGLVLAPAPRRQRRGSKPPQSPA